jgi:hypothetical protein
MTTPLKVIIALLILVFSIQLQSQTIKKQQVAPVRNLAGTFYKFPWAGGMNGCHFGTVDIDMDGAKDLVAFDRHGTPGIQEYEKGNRILPFINKGSAGEVNYEYAPQYVDDFPEMFEWMILVDYNNDGKEDIFTYSPGNAGMIVYKNVSGTTLEFELVVYPYLTSFQGAGYVNILVTYVDYPGIADLDGDGDLDILTFWGLGSFVEMHKNLSFEKYGHYDSLDYELTTRCWGYFAESEESNELTLDTCQGWRPAVDEGIRLPHTGSTFRVVDLNGDQVLDVLLGDVDYPNLVALNNTGTTDSARIGSFEDTFPSYNKNVHLYSLPLASSVDIDRDGLLDLVVSPFDPNPYLIENKFSTWYYRNDGTNQVPVYSFIQDDFFQDQMIDVGAGCYPATTDYNNDGLPDLFLGNYGYYDSSYLDQQLILHTIHTGKIALYENIGSAIKPEFTFITDDFAGISSLDVKGLVPSFADLDGDGDLDMACGYEEGKVLLYENIAQDDQPMELQLVTMNYGNIDVGNFSALQLYDLNKDGSTDMIVGEQEGNINYYEGSPGDPWMVFNLVAESLGGIDVTDPNLYLDGFSTPHFFSDLTGNTLLIVGSKQGELYFYNDIDDNLTGSFSLSDTLDVFLGLPGLNTDRGYQTSAAVVDLNNDGKKEMIAGNFAGGPEYFSMSPAPVVSGIEEDEVQPVIIFPNPAHDRVVIQAQDSPRRLIESIQLIQATGKLYQTFEFKNSTRKELNLADLPAGLYFLRIFISEVSSRNRVIYKKLVIY